MMVLKAPFPWFGGKSRVAKFVWEAFGEVDNYVEPFFGSGAVLLASSYIPKVETINDIDGFVCNFWRAVRNAPLEVAKHIDWPCIESDLHARHAILVGLRGSLTEKLEGDPEFFGAKIAGWWAWGASVWLGREWCSGKGAWGIVFDEDKQHNILTKTHTNDVGIQRQIPFLGNTGRGIFRTTNPSVDDYMLALSNRLKRVRVCCGDWTRVVTPAVTTRHGVTSIFLDPPYSSETRRDKSVYAMDSTSVSLKVQRYCISSSCNPRIKIALCGYGNEHDMLCEKYGWSVIRWKPNGGFSNTNKSEGSGSRQECIWFSPNCNVLQPILPGFDYSSSSSTYC